MKSQVFIIIIITDISLIYTDKSQDFIFVSFPFPYIASAIFVDVEFIYVQRWQIFNTLSCIFLCCIKNRYLVL